MTRGDVLHLEGIVEGRDDFLDVRIARYHEVKSAGNELNPRIDGGRRGNDLVDSRMRASDHDHEAFWRIDSQGQLAQFECSRFIGNQRDQMDVGSNLGVLVDKPKVRTGPGESSALYL